MATRTPWLAGAVGVALGAGVTVGGASFFVAHQAAVARRRIGTPLGEEALEVDRVFRKRLGEPVDVLVLGDSIAAGLGAESAAGTFAGQLARRVARSTGRAVRVRSVAVVGAETSMLPEQLDSLPPDHVADVAVVVVGGNDVIHRVPRSQSRRHLAAVITRLRTSGTEVVVGTCPDLGAVRSVPQPLRLLLSVLSRRLASTQRGVALGHGAYAVDLAHVVGPFFSAQPDVMFSVDSFHPSEAGYRRTAKALLPSVLAALGEADGVPFGHHAPGLL